ncbi:phosphatidylserine decarboxylase [Longimicrobium sp.]|uniref:phosphatidylserine decarboxylase n=1 Tax=Longimicrobium sp. TaxID=2029185 RepID=UPI002F95A21A
MAQYQPIVQELVDLIQSHGWTDEFEQAIRNARRRNIPELDDIHNLDDYLGYIDGLVRWVPRENHSGKEVYDHICKFYFILDQRPVLGLQNRVIPHDSAQPLTPLSAWMVRYARAMGAFLDTPESLTPESLQTFRDSPVYNMDEYLEPRGGWKTFNEFFARNFKPGYRPVAAVSDPHVVVSPADSTFGGQWEILPNSGVTVKNLHWQIRELMEGSPFRDRFVNGQFMHAFLNTTDYHRQHAPVGGTVVEARVIPGQVYLEVDAQPVDGSADGHHRLRMRRTFDAPDNPGYQFAQARGLVVLDTPIGLVAVLPIGMAQVSSVVVTAEVGVTLRKGEEISYFQFGGSDIIVLFESRSNVSFTAQQGIHYKMGTRIAQAYPVG